MIRLKSATILALLFLSVNTTSTAKVPLDAVLKTRLPDDAYANDGLSFRALCYHDARDHLLESFESWPERGALQTSNLIDQFSWLRENGYHMVSLDAILAARNGGPKLPPKAVLLSFDDGYLSVYTRVFPLLKLFNYPAVIGLVGEWLEEGKGGQVFYGDRWISRRNFVTWPQVREMAASGLVEVASHSHSLHKGVTSNPQGSLPSSAITRIYDPERRHYETDSEFLERIRADLARNNALIARETGKKPRTMIWPYGAFNMLGVQASEAEGMPIVMTLDPGPNTPEIPLNRMRREMLMFNDKVSDLKINLLRQAKYDGKEQPLDRIVAVDLETLSSSDPAIQEQKIGDLIDLIHQLRVNVVYVRTVADLDNDGYADTAYFPNRHLPLRSDLFNRVVWQLNTRASSPSDTFYVYAWMPALNYEKQGMKINNRQTIIEIYDDMAKNAPRLGGLLIGDETEAGHSYSPDMLTISQNLISTFKVHQPTTFVARFISADAQLIKPKDKRFSNLTSFLDRYDFVVFGIRLSVADEGTDATENYLEALTDKLSLTPKGLDSAVFLLQAPENSNPDATSRAIGARLQLLQQNGARNYGFYPYQLIQDKSSFSLVKQGLSLHTNPGHTQ